MLLLEKFLTLQNSTLGLGYSDGVVDQDISSKIKPIIKNCARQLNVQRVSVWFYQNNKSSIVCQHLYQKSINSFDSGLILSEADHPRYFTAIKENRVLAIAYAKIDPKTSEFTDSYLTPLNIESMLDVPIFLNKDCGGVLCIEHTDRPRKWDMAEISYAISLADMISLAYAQFEWYQENQQLQYSERADSLTNLENRYFFQKRIEHDINSAIENDDCTLLSIGIDKFTAINDKYGYDFANKVLCTIASRLEKKQSISTARIARVGGDEFAIWISPSIDSHSIEFYIKEIHHLIGQEIHTPTNELITLSASIGLFTGKTLEIQNIDPLRKAEIAMKRAKTNIQEKYCVYDQAWESDYLEKQRLENEFLVAINSDQIVPHFQPIIGPCSIDEGISLESLVRWNHPTEGLLSPYVILPLARRLGKMDCLGNIVIQQTFKKVSQLLAKGIKLNKVSINITSEQLNSPELVPTIISLAAYYSVPFQTIEFEIVEEVIAVDSEVLSNQLLRIAELGIQLSIDDFGTGYSCLSRLKNLRVSKLKIDKSFIDGLPSSENDICIAKSIIGMAKGLNLKIVAEGVETIEQAKWLLDNGCDYLQGYLFSRPIPAEDVINFVEIKEHLSQLC